MPGRITAGRWARVIDSLAVFAACFGLAWLCLLVPRAAGTVTPLWLPTPALLAIMMLSSRRRWRAFASAGLLGQALAHLASGTPLLPATVLAFCDTLEVVVCALLVLRILGRNPILSRPRNIGLYAVIVGACSIGGAALAALSLRLLAHAPGEAIFATWALADFAGLLVVMPCLLLLARNRESLRVLATQQGWPLAVLLAIALAVFFQDRYPLTYLLVAALLLVTWRLRMMGAALGVLATLVIAVGATLMGHGPFALMQTSTVERVLTLQLFLGVCFYLSVPVAVQNARGRALRERLVRALASARTARGKYRRIADSSHDIIVQTDRERFLYVSPACERLGYAPAELIGQWFIDYIHPDDVERLGMLRRQLHAGGPTGASEWRIRVRAAGGDYRWLEGAPNLLRDREGRPIAIENVFRDVTDRLAAEQALAASETRYRLLAENLTDVATTFGADGLLRFASPAVRVLLGYEAAELVGRPIAELVHPDDTDRVRAEFARHRDRGPNGGTFKVEYRMFRKDGSLVWVEAHPRAIFDTQTGAFVEWQDVVRDIGERKALEAELRAARTEAEAAAQAKSDFLANMSHELRTPLTSVIGFARLAQASQGLEGPVRTYVERMGEASRSLLALVNDVLDFSKLEAGDLALHPRPTNVSELVEGSLRMFEPQGDEKGLLLSLDDQLPPGLELEVDGDRLHQLLLNLVGNAVKFTHAGGVWVTLRYHPDTEMLSVEVRDTGPGISAEDQTRLFQRFSQVDGSQARRYGGTGLGLAICRGIVSAMGGEIGVTSEEGRGSTFAFSIPAPPFEPASAEHDADPMRIRLLLAEDHADIRELVTLFLKGRVDVTEVSDGETAVRLAAERPFDVMLLDLRMPGLGGAAALRSIREHAGLNRATPALAFSADGHAVSAHHAHELGFEGLVAKPVSPIELVSAIAHVVSAIPARTVRQRATPPRVRRSDRRRPSGPAGPRPTAKDRGRPEVH